MQVLVVGWMFFVVFYIWGGFLVGQVDIGVGGKFKEVVLVFFVEVGVGVVVGEVIVEEDVCFEYVRWLEVMVIILVVV